MAVQLTSEQEHRIQAVVNAGAYTSVEEALNAAIAAVEAAAAPQFEGPQKELEALLKEGVNSGELVEADEGFWTRLRAETDQMVTEHEARKPRR